MNTLKIVYRPTSSNVLFQWRCHPSVYVVYRCVVALYFTVWIILSGVLEYGWTASDDQRIKWFIYLTNWSYFLLTVSVLFQAAVVGAMYCTGGASSVTTSSYNVTQGFFLFLFLSVLCRGWSAIRFRCISTSWRSDQRGRKIK